MIGYIVSIWKCRYFLLSLVNLDLRLRYRRSMLGLGWSLLQPLTMMAIMCTVFHKVFHISVRDYATYLLAGLACWNYFLAATLQGCQCFFQGECYIRQYPAPLALYPLRTALGGTIHFLLALALVSLLAWYVNGVGTLASIFSLVPSVLLCFLFAWSLALLAGFATVYFRDTQHLCEIAFQILFYATPVMYNADLLRDNHMAWLADFNPLAAFLNLIRVPLLEGRAPLPATFAMATVTAFASFVIAALTLVCFQRRLIFHL